MEPKHSYSMWVHNEAPQFSSDMGLLAFEELLNEEIDTECGTYTVDDNTLTIKHDWIMSPLWMVYDMERKSNHVHITDFEVRNSDEWDTKLPIKAQFKKEGYEHSSGPPSISQILSTMRKAHPFDTDSLTPEMVEFKCGDISRILRQSVYTEYGVDLPIVGGGVWDPDSKQGWPHGFIRVLPQHTVDTSEPVIIDGTAKQFCDGAGWPQTLGPEDEIDGLHTVRPDDEYYENYCLNRDLLEET